MTYSKNSTRRAGTIETTPAATGGSPTPIIINNIVILQIALDYPLSVLLALPICKDVPLYVLKVFFLLFPIQAIGIIAFVNLCFLRTIVRNSFSVHSVRTSDSRQFFFNKIHVVETSSFSFLTGCAFFCVSVLRLAWVVC